jgi:hypothetical protein
MTLICKSWPGLGVPNDPLLNEVCFTYREQSAEGRSRGWVGLLRRHGAVSVLLDTVYNLPHLGHFIHRYSHSIHRLACVTWVTIIEDIGGPTRPSAYINGLLYTHVDCMLYSLPWLLTLHKNTFFSKFSWQLETNVSTVLVVAGPCSRDEAVSLVGQLLVFT